MKPLRWLVFTLPLSPLALSAGEPARFSHSLERTPLSLQDQVEQGRATTDSSLAPAEVQPILHRDPDPTRARRNSMPVIEPDPTVDYKMRIKRPDASIEYSLLQREVPDLPERPRRRR